MKEPSREKGVIYARYSSSGQRDESIEGQLRECRDYAERHGILIVGEYCDHAMSGTSDRRPEFQRMIRDSSRGQFTVCIVWKNDRFARNRYDSAVYKYRLNQNGVRLLYAKETIPEGAEGIILESVMEGFAEYYSANLSENVKRGNYDSALKHQTLGVTLYGLRKAPDGRFEQNPEQAPIVRRIYEEYAGGKSAKNICADLNAEGFRTNTGGRFNGNSINRILTNEKYCGVYRYADIIAEDGIPAIVSRDLFDRVQGMVKLHAEKPNLKKEDGGFLLTGKLFCGTCGAPMTGDSGTGKLGKVYQYYTCVNRHTRNGHTCTKASVSKKWAEDTVVRALMDIAGNDGIMTAIADRFMEWQSKQKKVSPAEGLTAQLREVERATQNVLSLVDSGFITDSVKTHLMELEAKRTDLEELIAKAEASEPPTLTREQVLHFLHKFRDGDAEDVGWRIFIVDTFLKAAFLYDDGRLILQLNYNGDGSTVTVETAEEAVSGQPVCSDFAPLGAPPRANLNPITVYFHEGAVLVVIGFRASSGRR